MSLWRVRTEVDDRPGRLAAIASAMATHGGNILMLSVQRDAAGPVDEFLVRAPARLDQGRLARAVTKAGGRRVMVAPAATRELVDGQTRALLLAARLANQQERLPEVLVELLRADECRWEEGNDSGGRTWVAEELTLPLADGRALRLRRHSLPFTLTEVARAEAMVRFAGLSPGTGAIPDAFCDGERLRLDDGTELVVRRARPADLDELQAMHRRCSLQTRYRRYFLPKPRLLRRFLHPFVTGRSGAAVVAEDPGKALVAMACLAHIPEPGVVELGLVVEDAWQGRGLGQALLRRSLALAREQGAVEIRASILPGNVPMLRILGKAPVASRRRFQDGAVEVRLLLPALSCDAASAG